MCCILLGQRFNNRPAKVSWMENIFLSRIFTIFFLSHVLFLLRFVDFCNNYTYLQRSKTVETYETPFVLLLLHFMLILLHYMTILLFYMLIFLKVITILFPYLILLHLIIWIWCLWFPIFCWYIYFVTLLKQFVFICWYLILM